MFVFFNILNCRTTRRDSRGSGGIEKFDIVRKNWALVKDKNEKMGFIDKTGKEIIPVQYDSIEAFTKKKGLINDVSKKTEIVDVD